MVKVFARLCEKGKNFNEVPLALKDAVKEQILNDGYLILDDGTVTIDI